jgi:hypothetical protein
MRKDFPLHTTYVKILPELLNCLTFLLAARTASTAIPIQTGQPVQSAHTVRSSIFINGVAHN